MREKADFELTEQKADYERKRAYSKLTEKRQIIMKEKAYSESQNKKTDYDNKEHTLKSQEKRQIIMREKHSELTREKTGYERKSTTSTQKAKDRL